MSPRSLNWASLSSLSTIESTPSLLFPIGSSKVRLIAKAIHLECLSEDRPAVRYYGQEVVVFESRPPVGQIDVAATVYSPEKKPIPFPVRAGGLPVDKTAGNFSRQRR